MTDPRNEPLGCYFIFWNALSSSPVDRWIGTSINKQSTMNELQEERLDLAEPCWMMIDDDFPFPSIPT
jgi:hypothetical protein